MAVNPTFKKLLHTDGIKFTIILGSGFHRNALGDNSILSNWKKLLLAQDPYIELTDFYALDYEKIILRRMLNNSSNINLNAEKTEKIISDEICTKLRYVQKEALESFKPCYSKAIFNPKFVSDIISLNFDTISEQICCEVANIKNSTKKFSSLKVKNKVEITISYHLVRFPKGESIRFWYPHGSIHKSSKNILGIREYSKNLQLLERFRSHSKQKEKNKDVHTTWYHELSKKPVLIVGSDMKSDEWDIWFAIINRERNYAKRKNKLYKKPIFQMRECECKKDYRNQWFQPLFTGMTFAQQWKALDVLLENNLKSSPLHLGVV